MGLDMYLYGKSYDFGKHDYNIGGELTGMEIGYWRKANAIHHWFVENCQNGIDDCNTYGVSHEQLKTLRKLCEEVLDKPKKAKDLLPTQSGFFFGPTEYDEWYIQDLKDTIEIIDWALAQDFDCFEYHSSW